MEQDISHRERSTDLGIVRINNDAITTIASIAALEVRGVCRMGGGLARTLCDMFSNKGARTKGVKIKSKEGELRLTVSVVVDYGVDIPRIADEVQENVRRAVEKMAGIAPQEVDVTIEGVQRLGQPDKKKE